MGEKPIMLGCDYRILPLKDQIPIAVADFPLCPTIFECACSNTYGDTLVAISASGAIGHVMRTPKTRLR